MISKAYSEKNIKQTETLTELCGFTVTLFDFNKYRDGSTVPEFLAFEFCAVVGFRRFGAAGYGIHGAPRFAA